MQYVKRGTLFKPALLFCMLVCGTLMFEVRINGSSTQAIYYIIHKTVQLIDLRITNAVVIAQDSGVISVKTYFGFVT